MRDSMRATFLLAWRAVRAALVFVVALLALYLLVGNALLLARVPVGYFESRTQSVRIDYDSAWTWWPGRLSTTDLVIGIQQRSEELEIRAEEASAKIHVDDLVRGTIHLSAVDAREVTFRFRKRRDDVAQAEAAAAMLPPIAAFGPLAVKDGTQPSPRQSDAEYDKWRIQIEDVSATVREVWVEGLRVSGPAALAGGFEYKPQRWLRLLPTRGRMVGGRLERMGLEQPDLLVDVDARFAVAIPEFLVEHDAVDVLRFMDLDLSGDAMTEASALLAASGVLPQDAKAFDGSGPLHAHLAARQGRLVPGSRVSWQTVHLDVVTPLGRAVASGPARVTARAGDADEVDVRAHTTAIDVRLLQLVGGLIHGEGAWGWMRFRAEPHVLASRFDGAHVSLPAANLGLVGVTLAPEARFEKGIAFARGVLDVSRDRRLTGKSTSRVDGLVMNAAGMKIAGNLTADLDLEEATLGDHVRVRASSFLRLEDMSLTAADERVTGWWGRIEAKSSMERRGDGPTSTQTRLHGRYRDAEPVRAILEGAGYIPGIVGDQLEMEGLVATGVIESLGPRVQVDLEDATGEGARVRGRMVESGEELRASFLVETRIVDVGVAIAKKKTSVQMLAGEDWLAEETAFLGRWQRAAGATRGKSSGPIR